VVDWILMRKILLGLVLLVMIGLPSEAQEETFYCYYQGSSIVKPLIHSLNINKTESSNKTNRCTGLQSDLLKAGEGSLEISRKLYEQLKDIDTRYRDKWYSIYISGDKDKFTKFEDEWRNALVSHYNKYYETTAATNLKENQLEKKAKTTSNQTPNKKFISEDSKFSKKCEGGIFSSGYKKGTKEFDDCINKEEKLAALDEQKKQIINDEKNKKAQQKQELDQDKIREEQSKILKMKPEDRLAYTCSEKFGFRKGSDKFKDCVFKLYAAEVELEKLELQRQLAKANAETARANAEAVRAGAERQERLALAQTEAAKMQALAARQQAIAANTADSMALIESGLRMMSPQRQAPRMQTNCFYHARSLSCF